MWISRKRFEEMEKRMDGLSMEMKELKDSMLYCYGRISELENCHYQDGMSIRSDNSNRIYRRYTHYYMVESAQTDLLGSVTIQELASLIIDGKPIVREDSVKVRKEFGLK